MTVKSVGGIGSVEQSQDTGLPETMPTNVEKRPGDVKPEVEKFLDRQITSRELSTSVRVIDTYQKIKKGDKTQLDQLVNILNGLDDPTSNAVIIASTLCGAWLGALLAEENRLKDLNQGQQKRLERLEEDVRKATTVTPTAETRGKIVDRIV